MVIVKLRGGLGNQMFQYACARNIQIQLKQNLVLDVSDFAKDNQRSFSLSNLSIPSEIGIEKFSKYNSIYDRRTNQLLRIVTKISPEVSFSLLAKMNIFVYEKIEYININTNSNSKNVYLNGYWQSKKYFENIQNIIKNEFKVSEKANLKNDRIFEYIRSSNSVCVHIRRGDYLNPENHLCVCNEKYYSDAINLAEELLENPIFFIFSDDILSIKRSFIFLKKNNVVFIDEDNKDFEEMQLMSSCNNFIISNSSFSWWAQYLSSNSNKLVIAPDAWYTDNRKTDIYIDSWNLIHCNN